VRFLLAAAAAFLTFFRAALLGLLVAILFSSLSEIIQKLSSHSQFEKDASSNARHRQHATQQRKFLILRTEDAATKLPDGAPQRSSLVRSL
jgi:MFS superfamily sulfate permease-like transporter